MASLLKTTPSVIVTHLLGIMRYDSKIDVNPTDDQRAITESAVTRMQDCGFEFTFANMRLIVEGPLPDTLIKCLPYPGWRILHQMMEEMYDMALGDVHDSNHGRADVP